jgi:16S rRNA (guanine527-N7)-methyltransferase
MEARVHERVSELCGLYELPAGAAGQLVSLLSLLASDPLAPTTVTDPAIAVDVHLADSLVALTLGVVRSAEAVVDIGSGAGFPGLPLAIGLPGAEVSLVESSRRKCDYLRRAVAAAGLANTHVVQSRAEQMPNSLERYDVATARALAPLSVVAEYAAPLLRQGGTLVAWKGHRQAKEEETAARAASELGLQTSEIALVQPFQVAEARHLYLMSKVSATPDRFPRRAGVARKRPLGESSDRERR